MKKKLDNHDFLEFLNQTYGTKDTDGDGICDEVELMIGTDPNKADTDGDGMNDGDEIKAGRNPLGPGDFRDFFVPHSGNNYRPHALHPKRLLFYVTSAVLIKVLVIVFVVSFPLTAWFSPDMMSQESDKIISLTNELRGKLGLSSLTGSNSLKQAAYDKAQDMLIQQYFAHNGPDSKSVRDWLTKVDYKFEVAGENLAMGFAQSDDVVEAWIKSPTHYANLIDPDYSEIGVGMASGPFRGEETTLVAQYFARPKQLSAVRAQAVPMSELPRERELITSQPEVTVPVREIVESVLEVPVIVEPVNDAVIAKSKVSIVVKAPLANKLSVKHNNNLLVAVAKEAVDEYGKVELDLSDGQYAIVVEASLDGQTQVSQVAKFTIDTTAPELNVGATKVWLESLTNSDDRLLRVEALIDGAETAELIFADHRVSLKRADGARWIGQSIVYGYQFENLQTITPPVIQVKDSSGNTKSFNVSLINIVPTKSSWTEKYFFLKNNPSKPIANLFDVSTIFYRVLLILTGLALALALTLERRRQTGQTVLTTVAFGIFILFLLIV